MNELSLFTGVGGGLLGTSLLGLRTICAVENHPHAIDALMQRQDDGILEPFPIWDNICTFDGLPWRGRAPFVSAGFPCQAFSTAASGQNVSDDLWPETRRIVADVAAWYVFAENVSKRAIDTAADDLEQMGYQTRAISLGAADLGGDHVRTRYWLLAYADDKSELQRCINAEMAGSAGLCGGVWQAEPDESGVDDGLSGRVDRYRATGNGQIPIVAAAALHALAFCD
ncbi:MAG TPA: DNA cytosine methyltransferase [Modicisalibacter sp.]|nr:DNA cytosine methyltransferase [Modicisalibacter sp.]